MARKASNKRRKAITGGGSPAGISPAAELISANVDLLAEIFLRLPAKSLIRFKSVSKHWLSLISHPQFSAKHSSRNPRPSISGMYFYHRSSVESLSLHGRKNLPSIPFVDGPEGTGSIPRIRNSCNGLLLCEIGSFKVQLRLYVVFNPTTQKYKVLPKPSGLSFRSHLCRDAYLAFDPSKSPHYKVVVGSRYNRSRDEPWCFEIDMYDSESGNWKKILPPDTCCGRGVFHNGAIHWLSYKNVLLRFEVDAEKMIALPLPGSRRSSIEYFGECGDCLIPRLILIQARSLSSMEFEILKLESDNYKWILTVRYSVNPETIRSAFPEMKTLFKFCVLCVVKGEKKKDYALVLAIPGKVISYNLKCNKLDVLRVQGELTDDDVAGYAAYAHPFVETISPV